MTYFAPIVAILVAFISISAILSSKFGRSNQDIPNERSLHSKPIPRIGGVGIMAGILSGWILMADMLVWWVLIPALVLIGISFLDDMRGLPVLNRLLAHLFAAVLLIVGCGIFAKYGLLVALAVFSFTVWMTNLYNFMDGSDGLAGGMALFGFGTYGIAALTGHADMLAMLNFSVAAAAAGFLFHNFPPAKIFMGDAGSITLGFLAAAMGVWGWQQGLWMAWFPVLVFSPFIVDATVTLAKRTLRGVKITEAHREHYYQRLVQLGWGHRNVALSEYALMLAVGMSALASLHDTIPALLFLAWGAVYLLLMVLIDIAWKRAMRGEHA